MEASIYDSFIGLTWVEVASGDMEGQIGDGFLVPSEEGFR